MLRSLYFRVRALFRSEKIHRQIEDEMRFHIEMRTEENIRAGLSPEEARREAEQRFGGLTRMKERGYDVRGGRSLETFWQDVRYSARLLLRRPAFTIVAVFTLALGIGATTAIFSIVNTVLLKPLPYEDADRLVFMNERHEQVATRWVSYPNFLDWRERNHSFEAMSTTRGWLMTLTGMGEPRRFYAGMVSAPYFSILRVRPMLGRDFLPEEDKPGANAVVILSYKFWQSYFGGDESAVGKTVTLDNRAFDIIGVMPREFQAQEEIPMWVLMGQWTGQDNWMQRDVRVAGAVIARLKRGVTIEQARADMNGIEEQLIKEHKSVNYGHTIRVISLQESIVGDIKPALLILLGAVAFLLLIACANVANLLLARSASRQKEFAVRTALGAGRARLMRQMLTESTLLALCGGVVGTLLAWWGVALFKAADPQRIPRLDELSLDWCVLLFTFLISLLTGVAFGFAPAWQLSKQDLQSTLKESSKTATYGRAANRLRGGLVVAEIALAFVLLVGAGLLIKSFARLLESNPGFDPKGVVTVSFTLPRLRYPGKAEVNRFYGELIERASSLPGVESASVMNNDLPGLEHGWQTDIVIQGRAKTEPIADINVDWGIVSADYFRTMGIPVLQGRSFTRQEMENEMPVVLVDEHLAREFWPAGDALGKYILYDSATPHEIIGIAGSVKTYGTGAAQRIKIYTPLSRSRLNTAMLALRLKNPDLQGTLAAIEREVHAIDKDLPLSNPRMLEQALAEDISPRRVNTILLTVFAAVALVLAAIGIYSVISYTVTQRTHEIGIRMAIGAQARDVLKMVVGYGARLALLGIPVGILTAFILTRLMTGLLYGVSAADPLTFISISVVFTVVALLACYIPARRATRVDPVIALRYE